MCWTLQAIHPCPSGTQWLPGVTSRLTLCKPMDQQHGRLPCPHHLLSLPNRPFESMMSSRLSCPRHPLLLLVASLSPKHQGLFQWSRVLHQVAEVLEVQASVLPMMAVVNWLCCSLTNCCFPRDTATSILIWDQRLRTQISL